MPKKLGRNDPCPCGSGKKYKRCCLPAEEAAARERAQQQALFEDVMVDDELDLDDEGDELFDVEDEPVLDVRTIIRVCYTRGFVNRISDLRSGRGVQVTEWEAPQIPHAVLASLEREAVDALEGEWGAAKISVPIQVDIIDLETDTDIVSIELFNRALSLVHADSEGLGRIHRVCSVLEAVASGAPAGEADAAAAVPVVPDKQVSRPPAEFDLSAVLKEHRHQGGICALCGETLTRASTQKHLAACIPAHDATGDPEQQFVRIRATAPGLPAYWLEIEVSADAKLDALDSFLREIWLECCGHLSAFRIGAVSYFSDGYDFGFGRARASLGLRQPPERSMRVTTGAVLTSLAEPFAYEYDFGSTTSLQLRVMGERTGRHGPSAVRLLVRNTPPIWPCIVCGQPASLVCASGMQGEGDAFVCTKHRKVHACGEDEGFLPIVNSPRVGVCAYMGQA